MSRARMAVASIYTHQHCRCYYRLRTIVRIIFWGAVIVGALWAMSWVDSALTDPPLPNYSNTTPEMEYLP